MFCKISLSIFYELLVVHLMTLKIVLCGDGSVGKTALRVRYMGLGFMPTYLMTIGADFSMRNVTIATGEYAGKKTLCQIWDLAGQQSFSGVRALYYHGAHGALLVYDCTRPSTFESILGWTMKLSKMLEGQFLWFFYLIKVICVKCQILLFLLSKEVN